jgi:hypothetical protein
MADPFEGTALPQGDWNPPGGEVAFDDLFGGAGDGSSDVLQVEEAQSLEQQPAAQTDAREEAPQAPSGVKQTTLTQDPATGEFIRAGSTVYKSREDAIRGIETKDATIEQLRQMVAAASGIDPLKKGNAGNQPNGDVSYHSDPARYARDLRQAADHGEKTGDWRAYLAVQDKHAMEVVQQTVGRYAPVVQRASRQEALDSVNKEFSDFKDFYGTEAYHQALDARPKLKEAISYLEQNPDQGSDLQELYKSAYDVFNSKRLADQLRQASTQSNPTQPRMPSKPQSMTALAQRPGTAEVKGDLRTSAGRKALIAEFEARGGMDKQF